MFMSQGIVSHLNEAQLSKAIELLVEEFNPIVIYLFGSSSRNELREDSDIDIAFLTENDIDPYICFMKAQELADIFKREVDLINLNTSSTVFKAQVVGTGKIVYCSDDTKRMYFEMRALKEYALLNEEREVILNRIKKEGTVYGKDVSREPKSMILCESLTQRTKVSRVSLKIETIERCINRISEVYDNNPENINDYTKQDSIILNIQRACEAAIDLAMHIVSEKKLGVPQNSRDSFDALKDNNIINDGLNKKMKAMVGFRNIAVHDYRAINLKVVQIIIEKHLKDFEDYIYEINKLL